jgi:hypothetical protein
MVYSYGIRKAGGGYLSHYVLHMKQSDDKRRLMIGAPLILIVVFSFGFFLMHPDGSTGGSVSHTAESDTTASKKTPADSLPSASQLQNLPKAEPVQTASSSSAVAGDSTASSSNDSGSSASTTNTKTGTRYVKSGKHKQGGHLIQTVINGLLNGR